MRKLALPRLKSLMPQPRKKVSKLAATMARQLAAPPFDDYEDEPTTKLSTAFVVVFMLHLVAVGGIYGFHQIKKSKKEAEIAATPDLMSEIKKTAPTPVGGEKNGVVSGQKALVSVAAPQGVSKSGVASGGAVAAPAVVVPKSSGAAVSGGASAKVAPSATNAASKTEGAIGSGGGSAVIPASKPVVGGPANPVVQASTPGVTGASEVGSGTGKTYTVQKGDNPVTIAKRLGVAQVDLLKFNAIEDPKKLQIGQVLKVPPKKASN